MLEMATGAHLKALGKIFSEDASKTLPLRLSIIFWSSSFLRERNDERSIFTTFCTDIVCRKMLATGSYRKLQDCWLSVRRMAFEKKLIQVAHTVPTDYSVCCSNHLSIPSDTLKFRLLIGCHRELSPCHSRWEEGEKPASLCNEIKLKTEFLEF